MTTADPAAQHIPEDAMRRLAEMKPGQNTSLFTSDLSVNEFLLVRAAGFRPLGLVLGSSNIGQNVEIPQYTEALYDARELAMSRMQAEAEQLEAAVAAAPLGRPHDGVLRDRHGGEAVASRPPDRQAAARAALTD